MIQFNGKYNQAWVYANNVDETTAAQVLSFLNHPAFAGNRIAIMPDCHAGKGSCIGFTMPVTDKVVPNVVGVDIGCGVASVKLPGAVDFQKLDSFVRDNIPFGFNIHSDASENRKWLSEGETQDFEKLSVKIKQKSGKVIESLGTLGGGNHFLEVDEAPGGDLWLVVHSGSRNLGMAVANYHQAVAKQTCVDKVPRETEYLSGEFASDYLADMHTAQRYAERNRMFILRRILTGMFGAGSFPVAQGDYISCTHNYISEKHNIIRKGAISAHEGEAVLIPINMRDGIIFGKGKGNPDWNWSAPHGAGRLYSRSRAKKELSVEDFVKQMEGVWTSCVGRGTLDEAPGAYKPMQEIMDVIGETVDVSFVAKPVYNFKASEEKIKGQAKKDADERCD